MRRITQLASLIAALSLLPTAVASAASLEPVGSFDRPIFVTSDPSDASRLFVVEREGRVIEVSEGQAAEFADLSGLVSCCTSERGLLSIAMTPDFPTSGRFYAAYTGTPAAGGVEGDIHVDAFHRVAAGEPLLREPIIAIGHADFPSHNGGQLQFGPDGYLYLSTGDGGGSGDPLENGQSLDTLLGKVLRIDPRPGADPSYEIPPDNPFVAQAGLDEIWSYGLRNPWRFSFDRANGDMVLADVGQGAREEVDLAVSPQPGAAGGAGANYGWNCREGFIAYVSAPPSCTGIGGFIDPVFDYPHANPGGGKAHGCSITGGYVVRDPSMSDLYGRYVYADFCTGEIRSLALPASAAGQAAGDRSEGLKVSNPVSFGEDAGGRLYVASNQGAVYRLVEDSPPAGDLPTPTPVEIAKDKEVRVRLWLSRGRVEPGHGVELVARVTPCQGQIRRWVWLRKGGRPFKAKRLNRGCVARFRPHVTHRATFRALLQQDNGNQPIRSRRLVISFGGRRG